MHWHCRAGRPTIPRMPKLILPSEASSPAEFIDRHAAPGMIGLIGGGGDAINRAIRLAQRGITQDGHRSLWSHALIFTERRMDGRQWVLESDIETHRGHVRWGVQENRADKYHNGAAVPAIAILDFGLSPGQVKAVLSAGLDLLASGTRYPLRELIGTLATMRLPALRAKNNPLSQGNALYCSAMVAHCYRAAGIELDPAVATKHTAPEDLWLLEGGHTVHLWQAPMKEQTESASKLRPVLKKIVKRGKARVQLRKGQIKAALKK